MRNRFLSYYAAKIGCILLMLFTATSFLNAQLQANFSIDKNSGCSPLVVSFTNTTTGASTGAIYTWDFGNGNTSSEKNPGAVFIQEKNYTVTLTVNDNGKTSVKTSIVTVYGLPSFDFSVSKNKECIPNAVSFTVTSNGSNTTTNSYLWDFGDGITQKNYSTSIQHNYDNPVTATVSVTATSIYGCTQTIQKKDIVQILPALHANFSVSEKVLCKVTDSVQFTNNSNGPGVLSYNWDFGDGTNSAEENPIHVFNKKGIYSVSLTVNNSDGCSTTTTQTNYLNIASYKADFNYTSPLCENQYTYFNSASIPYPTTSEWFVDNQPTYFTGEYLGYNFINPGNYKVKLVNNFDNCKDSIEKVITVNPTPKLAGFITNINGQCGAPITVNFKDTTNGDVKWKWDFDASTYTDVNGNTQSSTYTYQNDGIYNVTLEVENAAGCKSTNNKMIDIRRPIVTIEAMGTPVCGPYILKFKAVNNTFPIATYNWSLGGGITSTEPEPERLFSTPGSYPITLNYVTEGGCKGTATYSNINVNEKPTIDFSAPQKVCGDNPVTFTTSSNKATYGFLTSYYWDFGDGGKGFGAIVTHSYKNAGVYTVTLHAYFGYCGDTTIIKTNYITVTPPVAKISSIENTCDGTRGDVIFTHESADADTVIWNFGDGTPIVALPASQTQIVHTYSKTGKYNVTLIAFKDSCSHSTSLNAYVLLKQKPVLTINTNTICTEGILNITVNNDDKNPATPGAFSQDYFVKFLYGDGTAFNGSLTYTNYYWQNIFTGELSNFDKSKKDLKVITTSYHFGCTDTSVIVPLQIRGSEAKFSVLNNNICFKQPILFRDESQTTSGNSIKNWEWNFGDGIIITNTTGADVSHTYNSPGQYYAQLRITDANGCISSTTNYTEIITVKGPKASFSVSNSNPTITETVYFYNYTNSYPDYNTVFKWDFGDGTVSSNTYPQHAYSNPGVYTVTQIVTNPLTGCSDTVKQNLEVLNFEPAFAFNKTFIGSKNCPPVLVSFYNNSYNYTRLIWDFGDSITADNVNYPTHVYQKPGKYIITLTVYGPAGITGTYKDSVLIQLPGASFAASANEGCTGLSVQLNGIAQNSTNYLWDFGDGIIKPNAALQTAHQYNTPGSYTPSLLATDSNGCTFSYNKDIITIHPDPILTITPANPVLCEGSSVELSASGASTYIWSPTTSLSATNTATVKASPLNDITYKVEGSDAIGCKGFVETSVKVIHPFVLTAADPGSICKGESVPLNVTGATYYNWINNTSGLNNITIPNPVASPTQTITYTVKATDEYKCFEKTTDITVTVNPLPVVQAGPDIETIFGNTVELNPVYSNDVISWHWSPSINLSCTDCASPVCRPEGNTAYIITATTANGCTASDTIIVKLACGENTIFIPNAFTPNNDNKNDFFVIKGAGKIKKLLIMNRWGYTVFERHNFTSNDPENAWDGTNKGVPLPTGVYIYLAEIECSAGQMIQKKGTVTLIR